MSNTDRLKNTTNSLIEKYAKTSWAPVLSDEFFQSAEFQKVLGTLMEEYANGQAFTPTFPSLFKSFDLCSREGVRVVIVNAYPSPIAEENDGLALSHPASVQKPVHEVQNMQEALASARTPESEQHSQDLTYLAKQGVMLLNFSMTNPVGKKGAHLELWRGAFQKLITKIAYTTVNTIFVFIGPDTEYLHKAVRKGQLKFFTPDIRGGVPWEHDDLFKKINFALEKQKKHPINW